VRDDAIETHYEEHVERVLLLLGRVVRVLHRPLGGPPHPDLGSIDSADDLAEARERPILLLLEELLKLVFGGPLDLQCVDQLDRPEHAMDVLGKE
jgi:hypothetical protein